MTEQVCIYFFTETTDLQALDVSYSPSNNAIEITCTFAKSSIVNGCYIVINTDTTNQNESFQQLSAGIIIQRNETELVAKHIIDGSGFVDLGISRLVVLGYDYESDYIIGEVFIETVIDLIMVTNTILTPTVMSELQSGTYYTLNIVLFIIFSIKNNSDVFVFWF